MPLHPQAQMVLDFMSETGFTFEGLTAEDLRARANMAIPSPIELPSIADGTVPGPAGDIPVRIYRPSDDTNLPVVVFFHGGGWVIGDLESHDDMARTISSKAECVVVAVDYRLAPEHKFPAAADDCLGGDSSGSPPTPPTSASTATASPSPATARAATSPPSSPLQARDSERRGDHPAGAAVPGRRR